MHRSQTASDLQDTLPRAYVECTLILVGRQPCIVHEIRADVVVPQVSDDVEPVLEITRMEGDDVDVASPRTPEPEGSLLFDEGLDGRDLVVDEGRGDAVDEDLHPVRA